MKASLRLQDNIRKLVASYLHVVQLEAGTVAAHAFEVNAEYLRMFEPDDLLLTFRLTAGLPAPGQPYIGSWEDPSVEVQLRYSIPCNWLHAC